MKSLYYVGECDPLREQFQICIRNIESDQMQIVARFITFLLISFSWLCHLSRWLENISSKTETLFTVGAKNIELTFLLDKYNIEWFPEWKIVFLF